MLNFGNKEFRNLQEQVLENAKNIETLKGRENLQIVIVNELPEVGNPNYIYLLAKNDGESPDVYDEYIWLEYEKRYEKIGGVSIDMTNYVTLDSVQTISGAKVFTTDTNIGDNTQSESPKLGFISTDAVNQGNWYIFVNQNQNFLNLCQLNSNQYIGIRIARSSVTPTHKNYVDFGSSSYRFKDLYFSGSFNHTNYYFYWENGIIFKTSSNTTLFYIGNDSSIWFYGTLIPAGTSGTKDIGDTNHFWKDIYITGSLKDGANTVSVANIASKVTSIFISGTFDTNGESTIDTEQAGTPEGLFIFTYGNCQCFLRLTATMISSADVTPIRVACPMIYNSGAVNGWLNITKAGTILVLKVTDGTNHVDSGFAWTLTKTNLI